MPIPLSFRIKSSDIKTRRFGDDMPPLSNANYNKIVNVIYTIVSDKLHRINEVSFNQRNSPVYYNFIAI